jgi:DNA-binding transcriptional ArsR family regulator
MKKRTNYVIRRREQLEALRSARRQEIVDVLVEMGKVSIAELAAAMGRPADTFYFHLRALTKAGLVRRAGERRRGGRAEALFQAVATELRLRYEPRDAANRRAVPAIVQSMLRLGARDFRRAFESPKVVLSGAHRELWALRKTGRLSPAKVAAVNRSIHRLVRAVSAPRGRGRLYAITILLTPVNGGRRSQRFQGATR